TLATIKLRERCDRLVCRNQSVVVRSNGIVFICEGCTQIKTKFPCRFSPLDTEMVCWNNNNDSLNNPLLHQMTSYTQCESRFTSSRSCNLEKVGFVLPSILSDTVSLPLPQVDWICHSVALL